MQASNHNEIYSRLGAWGCLAGGIGLACTMWGAKPVIQTAESAGVVGLGVASLALGSHANKLSGQRRDREIVAQQALKDSSYQSLLAQAKAAKPLPSLTGVQPGFILEEPTEKPKTDPAIAMATSIKHKLLAAPTRAGKSLLTCAFISALADVYGSDGYELAILDPKTSSWLGLERDRGIVTYVSTGEFEKVLRWFAAVRQKLELRIAKAQRALEGGKAQPTFKPFFAIADEFTSLIGVMQKADGNLAKALVSDLLFIAAQGAGLGIFLTVVTQSPNSDDIGLSAQLRDCFSIVCLGSPKGGYSSITKALTNNAIVPTDEAKELKTDLDSISGQYAYLTNLEGHWVLGVSPDYSRFEAPAPQEGRFEGVSENNEKPESLENTEVKSLPKSKKTTATAQIVNEVPHVSAVVSQVSPTLKSYLEGIQDHKNLHQTLCSALGQVDTDGKRLTKSSLLQKRLGLTGKRYTTIGKPLWGYLESRYGAIAPQ